MSDTEDDDIKPKDAEDYEGKKLIPGAKHSPVPTIVALVSSKPLSIIQRKDRSIHRTWEVECYECISKEDR